ncbi:hypothetical protein GGQ97_002335 [Sphingomonas kaistensis]|uniref:Uncharacterized protein n=1 Tax=Sphingomonas kaistensis TaxID=298708 RepID=A0A7X5Y8K4_9SPHN|nr:hypothetical protein [Sphingomonas kaistensis]NJC06542.1 hypothetical protein [Sphingomonas kaistensis]
MIAPVRNPHEPPAAWPLERTAKAEGDVVLTTPRPAPKLTTAARDRDLASMIGALIVASLLLTALYFGVR